MNFLLTRKARPRRSHVTTILTVALALSSLTACDKKDNSIQPASSDKPTPYTATAAATTPALPGVIPVPHELPGNTGTGPGQGATAVGGMTGRQEAGGQNSGPSQATGGDTSASSTAASGSGR